MQRVTLRPAAAARFRLWAYQALRDAWNVSATLQTRAGARGGVLTSSRQKGLFFFNYSGFIGQSNFDLGSSGGPLAYMRNNVLVRGALRRVFRDLAKREPRYFSGLVAGD